MCSQGTQVQSYEAAVRDFSHTSKQTHLAPLIYTHLTWEWAWLSSCLSPSFRDARSDPPSRSWQG